MKTKFTVLATCVLFLILNPFQASAECGIGTAASCEYITVQVEEKQAEQTVIRDVKYRINYIDGIEVQRVNVEEERAATNVPTNQVAQQLNQLRTKYPNGYYWDHEITAENKNETVNGTWIEKWADNVTPNPCNHDFDRIGICGCNAFDHATACWGFANKVFYETFGIRASTEERLYDVENISVGDHVRFNYVHSAIVIARDGDKIALLECNYNNKNCQIQWDRIDSIKNVSWYQHADNWDQIN